MKEPQTLDNCMSLKAIPYLDHIFGEGNLEVSAQLQFVVEEDVFETSPSTQNPHDNKFVLLVE